MDKQETVSAKSPTRAVSFENLASNFLVVNVVYPAGYLLILDFDISDPAELFVIRCQFWHI